MLHIRFLAMNAYIADWACHIVGTPETYFQLQTHFIVRQRTMNGMRKTIFFLDLYSGSMSVFNTSIIDGKSYLPTSMYYAL